MTVIKKLAGYIIFLVFTAGCKERYLPPITSPQTGYLVVEGFISSGIEPTIISLTRSTRLYDTANIVYEHNAMVAIESERHQTFPLTENADGVYVSAQLNLDSNEKYRLLIRTSDNKEYASDFVAVKQTPPIDSISWARENNGVRIYINTHDPNNNTRYYQWKYEETWEIRSTFQPTIKYLIDPTTNNIIGVGYKNPLTGAPDTTIYRCWQSRSSTNIFLATSERLSEDKIYLPFLYIPPASEKISVLYSINIKQYALSHEAYLFFEKVKKNTEQVGSIFDPQPSELKGNIRCISDPTEIVIGYIDISEEKRQRLFISNQEVPGWNYNLPCPVVLIDNHPDSIYKYGALLSPTYPNTFLALSIIDFFATSEVCTDCTLRGINIKPLFWP